MKFAVGFSARSSASTRSAQDSVEQRARGRDFESDPSPQAVQLMFVDTEIVKEPFGEHPQHQDEIAKVAKLLDEDLLSAVTDDGKIYKYLSSERREDAELAKAAYKASKENYEYIPPRWRDGLLSDAEKISRARGVGYKYLPVNDRITYAKVAVTAWSGNYVYVPMAVRSSNEELAMLAVADKSGIYYQFVPEEIRAKSQPLAELAIVGSPANRAYVPENILKVLEGK